MPSTDTEDFDSLETTWYVAFKNGDHWWNRWLPKGFQHVELWHEYRFGETDDDRVWMNVNPCVELLSHTLFWSAIPPWEREPDTRFVQITSRVPRGKIRSLFHFGPFTCVDTVKLYLGLWKPLILTPRQLWNYLNDQKTKTAATDPARDGTGAVSASGLG